MYYDYDNQCTVTSPPGADGSFFECMDITIQKESSPGIFVDEINTVYFGRYYSLYPGIYRIKLSWHDLTQIGSWGYVDLSWEDLYAPRPVVDETTELKVGGLRIAKIIDYDPVTGLQNTRNFNYEFNQDDPQLSGTSGTVQDVPLHLYSKSAIYYLGEWNICENCVHLTSYSNAPILQTQGGHVGYKKVTVGFGENNGGGKQVSYFLSPEDYPDENIASSHLWPFPRVTDYDWRRGNLLNEKSYESLSNQSFGLKKSVLNQYQFNNSASDNNYKKIINVKVDKRPGLFWDDNQTILIYSGCYSLYNTATESFYITESSNSIKTAQGDIATETTFEYDHDMYLGLSSTLTTNSNEEALRVVYKYAYDYDNVENFDVLESNNIIAKPIDVRTYNNNRLISGTQIKYNNYGQPTDIYVAETGNGITDIAFDPATPYPFTHKATYQYNPNYKTIKQVSPDDNINTAYLWDNTGTYVMAKVENATYSQISAQDGKACTYNSLALFTSLKALVPGAMITTFTHKPLVGITQQTDPAGRTIYYEYDNFGRLKLVRDQNGNIVSKNEYHYAGQ
jgi:YD repeat-containing protein